MGPLFHLTIGLKSFSLSVIHQKETHQANLHCSKDDAGGGLEDRMPSIGGLLQLPTYGGLDLTEA